MKTLTAPVSRSEAWLKINKHRFGTRNGLPGEFHREVLFNQIKAGATVALLSRQGNARQGRVVMESPSGGWVVNLGGAHGTPGIVDARNCVYVQGADLGKEKPAPVSGYTPFYQH